MIFMAGIGVVSVLASRSISCFGDYVAAGKRVNGKRKVKGRKS